MSLCVCVRRLLDFRRVPPVTGRYINLTSDIRPFADSHLNKTFFTSPGMMMMMMMMMMTMMMMIGRHKTADQRTALTSVLTDSVERTAYGRGRCSNI